MYCKPWGDVHTFSTFTALRDLVKSQSIEDTDKLFFIDRKDNLYNLGISGDRIRWFLDLEDEEEEVCVTC